MTTEIITHVRDQLTRLPDLARPINVQFHRDVMHDLVAVRIIQTLGRGRLVAQSMLTGDLVRDVDPAAVAAFVVAGADRALRPWRYPDPPAFPTFDLYPVWAHRARRLRATWRAFRLALRGRYTGAPL